METIKRLRHSCEMAESLIAGNQIVPDEKAHPEPFHFKIGDFGVVDLRRRDWERNSALENWFPLTAAEVRECAEKLEAVVRDPGPYAIDRIKEIASRLRRITPK